MKAILFLEMSRK